MIKILVFTNRESWRGISDSIRDKVEWDSSYPNYKNILVKCDFSTTPPILSSIQSVIDEGVYLLFDKITMEEFDRICKGLYQDDEVMFLYHTGDTFGNGVKEFPRYIREKYYVLQGKHENYSQYYYHPLFEILSDNKDSKTIRILNCLIKQEEDKMLSEIIGKKCPIILDKDCTKTTRKLNRCLIIQSSHEFFHQSIKECIGNEVEIHHSFNEGQCLELTKEHQDAIIVLDAHSYKPYYDCYSLMTAKRIKDAGFTNRILLFSWLDRSFVLQNTSQDIDNNECLRSKYCHKYVYCKLPLSKTKFIELITSKNTSNYNE